jgi:sugar phosphate permease
MIGVGLCGAGLCNLAMGLIPSAGFMPLIWAFNGLFHSMLWAPIIRTFTDLLPTGRKEKAGTNISASCSVGAVLAFLLPGFILRFANWRVVFYISGGILLTAFLIWVVGNHFLAGYIRMMEEATRLERAAILQRAEMQAASDNRKVKRSLLAVLISSGLWVVLFSLICNGALRDAVESWAPTFMADQFALDSSTAAIISVVIPIISITGTYFSNWLFLKKLKNELKWVEQTDNAARVRFIFIDYMIRQIRGGYFMKRCMTPAEIGREVALEDDEKALFAAYNKARYAGQMGREELSDSLVGELQMVNKKKTG